MKKDILIVILLTICVVTFILTNFADSGHKIYDCSLSEISPDYPIEVKQECRKLRYEQYQQQQEELRQKRLVRT